MLNTIVVAASPLMKSKACHLFLSRSTMSLNSRETPRQPAFGTAAKIMLTTVCSNKCFISRMENCDIFAL